MPTLNWIGKQAVVNHHRQVPYRLLTCDAELSAGDPDAGNLLVQGDNLEALKALLPYYAGQVKCIYIDPPYNTGNEGWVYNDNVNSPEMRKWLHQTVGGEAEDLSRHDKWLCMMYPRLTLLREFLRKDGAIFVSIDDNEVHSLRFLLDEIFSPRNFLATIVWQKRTAPDARLKLGPAHDFIVCYARDLDACTPSLKSVPLNDKRRGEYKNPDNDPRRHWASRDMSGQKGHAIPSQFYELTTPSGKKYSPPPGRCWAFSESSFKKLVDDGRVWFGKKGSSRPRLKLFLSESEGTTAWTWWTNKEVGHNQEATKELNEILGTADAFTNPKPTRLIKRILELATGDDCIVLDSFAGSGTTGHAVLDLNKSGDAKRRFILLEMEEEVCQKVAAQRLSRVILGYPAIRGTEATEMPGLGGGFRYCRLGTPLFDETGNISTGVAFADLAAHVFFTETGLPIPKRATAKSPLLGVHQAKAVYLLFNGVMGDKRANGGNVLTNAVLAKLPPHDGPKVVYGEACRLSAERLAREGVVFRQIPYEIKVT